MALLRKGYEPDHCELVYVPVPTELGVVTFDYMDVYKHKPKLMYSTYQEAEEVSKQIFAAVDAIVAGEFN